MQADLLSDDVLAKAVSGNEAAFATLVGEHRKSIFRHCYQMLGSIHDAEDATQEVLERAWRRIATFDGSGSFGGWLYRISSNVCLDHLRKHRDRGNPTGEGQPASLQGFAPVVNTERQWVEPVNDIAVVDGDDPGDDVVRQEEISLAFVAALQRLAPRQRAALLLVDVLGFRRSEAAEVLGVNAGAINSLLSHARSAARARPQYVHIDRSDPRLVDLLDRYVHAWRIGNIEDFVALVTDDVRLSMPPMSEWFEGRDVVGAFIGHVVFSHAGEDGIILQPGWCNGQPTFAVYQSTDDGRRCVSGLQVLDVVVSHGQTLVRSIVSYRDAALAVRCGFPNEI